MQGRQSPPQLRIGLGLQALRILGNQHLCATHRLGAEQQRELLGQVVFRAQLEWFEYAPGRILQERVWQRIGQPECVEQFIGLVYRRLDGGSRVIQLGLTQLRACASVPPAGNPTERRLDHVKTVAPQAE